MCSVSRVPWIFNTSCIQEADACLSCSGEGLGWISPSSSQAVQGCLSVRVSGTLISSAAVPGMSPVPTSTSDGVGILHSPWSMACTSVTQWRWMPTCRHIMSKSQLFNMMTPFTVLPFHTPTGSPFFAPIPSPFLKPLSDWYELCSSISPEAWLLKTLIKSINCKNRKLVTYSE